MRMSAPASAMLDPVDLTDPASFPDGPPYAFLRRLQQQAPVWWHPDGLRRSGFWVVTRYEDVRAVLLAPTTYINAAGITIEPGEPAGLGNSEDERGQGALSYIDPPQHGPLRKVLAQHFTPARIRALAPLVRGHARRIVGGLVAGGGGDFVTDVVDPYPLVVLSAVLGLPDETATAMRSFVAAMDGAKGSAGDQNETAALTSASATVDFLTAVQELAIARKREPGPDLVSAMVTGSGEGAGLAAERIGGILIQLAIAGNETTRGAAGLGMRLMLDHPDQWAAVVRDPALVSAAVEEMLRFRPPVQYTRRTAAIAAPLGAAADSPVAAAGDVVYLSIAAANRDPEVLPDGDRFLVERPAGWRTHLSFGVGAHFCLGAALARLELNSLFVAVAELAPAIRLAGAIGPGKSNQFIDSLSSLPVTVR
jgi:cytochrome P450